MTVMIRFGREVCGNLAVAESREWLCTASLAPRDPRYRGRYGGDRMERDGAYHQGPVWGWLLGPFALAHLRVHGDRDAARRFLEPMASHLADYGVGSVAETLRAWRAIDESSPTSRGGRRRVRAQPERGEGSSCKAAPRSSS